jgi:hypothetical protein
MKSLDQIELRAPVDSLHAPGDAMSDLTSGATFAPIQNPATMTNAWGNIAF